MAARRSALTTGLLRPDHRQQTEETNGILSRADHSASPPRIDIPRDYNAAHDLLERNAARVGKVAFIDASPARN